MRVVALVLALATSLAARETVTLDNGLTVVLVPIEGSERFNLIAFLPLGLARDGEDQVQWSHLLEHLIVTGTGPAPFDEVNAETLGDWMHLDYTRPAATWRDGVAKLRSWLTVRRFDAEAVRRETGRVVAEVRNVAAHGATGKFALAAWAQAVRHGATRVAVHGDLAKATPDALAGAYRLPRPPVVAVSGRFDRTALLEALGAIELPACELPAEDEDCVIPDRVTWDLPTSHDVHYLRLPGTTARERALLAGAAQVLRMAWIPPPLLEADLDTGRDRFFVAVAAAGPPGATDAVKARLAHLATHKSWPRGVRAHLAGALADRPFVPPLMGERAMAEAYAALEAGRHAFRYGDGAYEAALEGWDDDVVRADVARLLDPRNLRVLRIEPE